MNSRDRLELILRRMLRRAFTVVSLASGFAGAAYFTLDHYVEQILESDATNRAQAWSSNLVENVSDLPEIIDGATPADESVVFLEQARAVGDVWQFQIYGPDGRLLLVSNRLGKTHQFTERLNHRHATAESQIQAAGIFVATRRGTTASEPEFMAEVIAPITFRGSKLGYLGLQIDETARLITTRSLAAKLAAALIGLVLLAFVGPAIAFMRRSRQKEAVEGELEYLAYHDALTGLKNRLAITQAVDALVARPAANLAAIHIIDLDNFKVINDTLGHDAGDACLREASARLASVCSGHGELGRLGGDEFLFVQNDIADSHAALVMAAKIVTAFKKPFSIPGNTIETGVSVGSALFPADGATAADLIKSADIALYYAKSDGRGCFHLFKPEFDEELQRRRRVEARIREALKSGGFVLHYQPLTRTGVKTVESVEALIRLTDVEGNIISPAEFIPIAEEAGLIAEVGNWVIRESCRTLSLLPGGVKLALNLSPIQFERSDLPALIAGAAAETGADLHRLELEITEGLLLKDCDGVRDTIARLKALGCSIVLDDFGAGYSSLNYLWRYPFDKIKIDRSFVSAMTHNSSVAEIVKTIIQLAKRMNMQVTAEGVETSAQAKILEDLSCDQMQGYLYSKPLTMSDLSLYMLRQQPVSSEEVDSGTGTGQEVLIA